VVADALGNIYISDTQNGRIKQRDSLGNITTVAGDGGTANVQYLGPILASGVSLLRPIGLALDQSGNLYIVDKGNSAIRKLQLSSNFISTTAGRAGTLEGPGPANSSGNSTRFTGDGGQAIAADFQYPFGVAVDSVRNVIYIADTFNNRVRKVDAQGVITTVAGSRNGAGAGEVNDPLGDPGSDGYRGDGGPATSAMLSGPKGLAVDSAGNLYIADTGNAIIRKVATNGIITTVAGTIPVLESVSPSSQIPQTGYSGDGGPATSAKLDSPTAVACDSAGNLYIADLANSRIRKVSFQSAPPITTPTSASIGSTSATLGGNVTTDGGTSITARGVVYAVTATNATPQLGGTGVTDVAGTGTTGVFTVNSTGKLRFYCYGNSAEQFNFAGATSVNTGQWVHVAAVRDASGNAYLYLNGTLDGSVTGTTVGTTAAESGISRASTKIKGIMKKRNGKTDFPILCASRLICPMTDSSRTSKHPLSTRPHSPPTRPARSPCTSSSCPAPSPASSGSPCPATQNAARPRATPSAPH
jgi:sugar lactone lactonase YvrE